MQPDHDKDLLGEPLPIRDRGDGGGGWFKAWPLIALALIGLMLVRACMTSSPPAPPAPPAGATAPR